MCKMKNRIYVLALLVMTCVMGLQAQSSRLSKEEFRRHQQKFITERAQLSSEEARQFFPLYFELQDKKQECNRAAWQKQRKGKDEKTTEEEYAQIVEDVIQARIDVDRMELEYVRKYKRFLSAEKIYLIQKAEMRFHRELLKDIRSPKQGKNKR